MDNRFNNSIDIKNSVLLKELENLNIQIEFEIKPEFEFWGMHDRPRYVIAAPNEMSNPEMLTHELLHIKLDELGFLKTSTILIIFNSHNCCFISKALIEWQNNLAHCKMIPEFVKLGYPVEKFTANYGCAIFFKDFFQMIAQLKNLKEFQEKNSLKPSISFITNFITILISTKNIEIENKFAQKILFNHNDICTELEKIDKRLFNSIYSELTSWIESSSSNFHFYNNLTNRLFHLGYPTEANWNEWQKE